MRIQYVAISLINIAVGLIEIILSLRLLLKLLSANPDSPFVAWLYNTSDTFLSPFANVFPTTDLGGGAILEFTTLFAIVIYAIVGWIITSVLELIHNASQKDKTRRSSSHDSDGNGGE